MAELGSDAIRFSSEPALGGPSTVVEVGQDGPGSRYRVSVAYLAGHPASGWRKLGSFHFWLNGDDFKRLLHEVEQAEQQQSENDAGAGGVDEDGERDIIVCTDGPGYITEIRSHGVTRWISGSCGDTANNAIASLMARLVRYGTGVFLKHLDGGSQPSLRLPDKE